MTEIDWRQGFRIESEGTNCGTKIFTSTGELIGHLTKFTIEFDSEKIYPKITCVQIDREAIKGVHKDED